MLAGDELAMKRAFYTTDMANMMEGLSLISRVAAPDAGALPRFAKVISLLMQMPKGQQSMMYYRSTAAAQIAERLGFSQGVQEAVLHVMERWDGKGFPHALRGALIPLPARIVYLAQAMAMLHYTGGMALARAEAQKRRGGFFDPSLVGAFLELSQDPNFQADLEREDLQEIVIAMEPSSPVILVDEAQIHNVVAAFAQVVDMKSPYTANHSQGVATMAQRMAQEAGLSADDVQKVYYAALLHDLGKMAVSNAILDKPAKLNEKEWEAVQLHPYYTQRVLEKSEVLREFAPIAGAHHERLDGSGYHRQLPGQGIPLEARILAVADTFQALSAERPYRPSMDTEQILKILDQEAGGHLDPDLVALLKGML